MLNNAQISESQQWNLTSLQVTIVSAETLNQTYRDKNIIYSDYIWFQLTKAFKKYIFIQP